ncbi:ATPase [Nostoc punctiforme NIES-2108]|uniref:ATPase n=1 Tax=Nostoc punctiforme NIES-2108 TaxID=1356359 RepID=A0A367RSP7_NOSPU|nr:ATPase [Nostoc punctiforme NIES-2108]
MLKQLILENWKSFRYAELPLDPLTVLIGTNSSGKSNVVEALEFLQRIARGENIEAALAGDKTLPSIRGGLEWAALKPETNFTLKALVQGEDDKGDYLYVIQTQIVNEVKVIEEYIERQNLNKDHTINYVEKFTVKKIDLNTITGMKEPVTPFDFQDLVSSHTYLSIAEDGSIVFEKELQERYFSLKIQAINCVVSTLKEILILNPIPSKMREYSRLSDTLESDASNIAGVLAALSEEHKNEVESTLSSYIKDFPEGDIQKLWAEKVGRFGTDAMLYCQEEWKPGHITEIDSRTMSDGTLRFLAILTALLTRPQGSQLVIEEIDNGLHPSRAELLVRILRDIGSKRKIDILLTTHNPALLDALGPEIVPFVVVAHRDKETGESKLTLLEDIENLPLLLASGTLGKLATKGAIEKSLSDNK